MNQELKNFDMLIKSLEKSFTYCDYGVSKTIVNIYGEMLPNLINDNLLNNYRLEHNLLFSNHVDTMKSLVSKIVNTLTPKLIEQGDFKSLHSMKFAQDKLKGFIESLEPVLKEFEIEYVEPHYDVYKMLDMSIKNGILLTQTNESTRAIGKSSALIRKAFEYECTIVVGRHSTKHFIDNLSNEMGFKIDCQYISDLVKAQGRRMKNGKFLVDDSTTNQIIKELVNNRNEFLGGFNSLHESIQYRDKAFDIIQDELSETLEQRNAIMANHRDANTMGKLSYSNAKISVLDNLIARYKGNK